METEMPPIPFYDPTGGLAPHVEALLAERAWLQRLARGLLSDPSGADDLAQEVLVAALKSPPRAEGKGMRAWLATTARRMAARGASREGYRSRVEKEAYELAGRQEERAADERLELSESVIHGLQGISSESRTVLVMRYLEDQAYSVMADRLGLTESTVRQRVSRGLGELRRQLDADHGDRKTWVAALTAAVLPGTTGVGGATASTASMKAALGSTPSATAAPAPLLAFLTVNKLVFAMLALALLFFVPYLLGQGAQAGGNEEGQLDVAMAPTVRPPKSEDGSSLVAGPDGVAPSSQRLAIDAAASSASSSASLSSIGIRFRLESKDGAVPSAARAAWIRRDGGVERVEVCSDGTGEVPIDAQGFVMASAPGFSRVTWDLQNGASAVEARYAEVEVLQLQPLRSVTGRVEVEGEPPSHEFEIRRSDESTSMQLSPDWQLASKQLEELIKLGVEQPKYTLASTRPDGSFKFENVDVEASGFLILPSSFRNPRGRNARTWVYGRKANSLTLIAQEIPYVHGQVQWADTGEGVEGDLVVRDRNTRYRHRHPAATKFVAAGCR